MALDKADIFKRRLANSNKVVIEELDLTVWFTQPSAIQMLRLNEQMKQHGLLSDEDEGNIEIDMAKLDKSQQVEWLGLMCDMIASVAVDKNGEQVFTRDAVECLSLQSIETCMSNLMLGGTKKNEKGTQTSRSSSAKS